MGKLISGKEALIALANDEMVEMREKGITRDWNDVHKSMMLSAFDGGFLEFRLKPKTVEINGVKILIPNNIVIDAVTGSVGLVYGDIEVSKQVVEALRSIFDVK